MKKQAIETMKSAKQAGGTLIELTAALLWQCVPFWRLVQPVLRSASRGQ